MEPHGGRPLGVALAFRLQYRLRHFFHEQRDAIGALYDVLPDARGEKLVPYNAAIIASASRCVRRLMLRAVT